MSYVFRCLEWYGSLTVVLLRVCRIQARSKPQIFQLLFVLNKQKNYLLMGSFMNGFQNSPFQHLIYSLLESFFQVNWNWLTRGLLWQNIWIQMNKVWGAWEASNNIKYIRVSLQNLSLLVTNLRTTCFD